VEVYLEGLGWVTYDPTPPSAMPAAEPGVFSTLRQLSDTLEMGWFKYVIEYDLRTQVQMAEGAINWIQKRRDGRGPGLRARLRALLRTTGYSFGALSGLALLGYVVLRLRGRRLSLFGPSRPQADRLIRQALALLRRRGFAQRPGETLRRLAARVGEAGDPAAPPFAELVERYYACRFGGEAADLRAFRELTRALLRIPPASAAEP